MNMGSIKMFHTLWMGISSLTIFVVEKQHPNSLPLVLGEKQHPNSFPLVLGEKHYPQTLNIFYQPQMPLARPKK